MSVILYDFDSHYCQITSSKDSSNSYATHIKLYSKETIMATRTTNKRKYGLFNFAIDVILTLITSGFWLIWVFVREMRRR